MAMLTEHFGVGGDLFITLYFLSCPRRDFAKAFVAWSWRSLATPRTFSRKVAACSVGNAQLPSELSVGHNDVREAFAARRDLAFFRSLSRPKRGHCGFGPGNTQSHEMGVRPDSDRQRIRDRNHRIIVIEDFTGSVHSFIHGECT